MIDLDAVKYVLRCHRELPADRRPVWRLAMLRAADVEALRTLAPAPDASEAERAAAYESIGVATLGRSLRGTPTLRTDGVEVPPLPADPAGRGEWCRRWLPYRWLTELAQAAQDAADLDPEAE
jgi:hypothetical protein